MRTIDSILALKDHLGFKFVTNTCSPWQSKDKVLKIEDVSGPSGQWCPISLINATWKRHREFVDHVWPC